MRALPRSAVIVLAVVLVGLVALTVYSNLSAPSSSGPWRPTYTYPLRGRREHRASSASPASTPRATSTASAATDADSSPDELCLLRSRPPRSASATGPSQRIPTPSRLPSSPALQPRGTSTAWAGRTTRPATTPPTSTSPPSRPSGVGPVGPDHPVPCCDRRPLLRRRRRRPLLRRRRERDLRHQLDHRDVAVRLVRARLLVWDRELERTPRSTRPGSTSRAARASEATSTASAAKDSQDSPQNATYSSYVTSFGMGAWTAGPAYPIQVDRRSRASPRTPRSTASGGCRAEAPPRRRSTCSGLSASGLGAWQSAPSYPAVASRRIASRAPGFLYCVGGYSSNSGVTGASYFALLNGTASASASA